MTEFTKDDIEHYRKQYALWTSRRQTTPEELHLIGRLRETLDHIEHLQSRVQELEKENNRISVLLHNEMSQLELTIDLSNKRWIALNNIYTDGEKHNANWCKRKAQEGLGIK
jgi:hypothetical protein